MHPLLRKLEEGDRRSIGRSNEVVAEVLAEPRLFDTLFSGLLSKNPVLRMRAADAAEKVTAIHPEFLHPYKTVLIGHLAAIDAKEVRWHVAPMLARLQLDADERKRVVGILLGYFDDRSSIVKTLAMQALADIALQTPELRPEVLLHIRELMIIGTPAMKARGRKLLKQLGERSTKPYKALHGS